MTTMDPVLDPDGDEVYVAALEPRERSRGGRVLVAALDLWCATTGGTMELTRAGDVVVRRSSDDVEELRIPVRSAADAALLLDQVREQLLDLSPAAFRAAWGIE